MYPVCPPSAVAVAVHVKVNVHVNDG